MSAPIDKKAPTRPVSLPSQVKPYSEATLKRQKELNGLIDQGKLKGTKLKEDGVEGPLTRALNAEAERIQAPPAPTARQGGIGQAQPPAARDEVKTPTKTVGEYVENQIQELGKELKEDAQVAAISAVAAPVVGVILARNANQAREKISKLPMDPEGRWKAEANQILKQEMAEAKKEILALPGDAIDGMKAGKDAVVRTAQEAGQWVDRQLDDASALASKAWDKLEHHSGEAWNHAKEAVPRIFKSALEDAKVGAIALNPLGAGPSAAIVARHTREAYDEIAKLPMDPEGKWKQKADAIIDREAGEAKREILELPGRAWDSVADGARQVADETTQAVSRAVDATGKAIDQAVDATGKALHDVADATSRKAHEIADGTVNTARKVARIVDHEIDEARDGLGGAIQNVGNWLGNLGKRIAGQPD
ncbi:MAG: hypothetical protein VKP72_03275 [bacterium]|nr:hypothetical protein [bacterium]